MEAKVLAFLTQPPGPPQRRLLYLALLGLLGLTALYHAAITDHPYFPVDDAYIALHNAQVIHAGEDRNYAGTPAAAGATSLPHVALVAAFLVFLPPAWAMFAAAWSGIALYALALASLAFAQDLPLAQALLLIATGLSAGLTPHQLLNGLETGMAMAGLTWALALAVRNAPSRWWLRPIVYGQLPFLRPELAVASALLIGLDLIERRRSPAEAGTTLIIASLAAAPWLSWYLVSVGVPFASTIRAKCFYFAEGCLPAGVKTRWVLESLVRYAQTLGLVSMGAVLLWRSRLGQAGLVFIGAFVSAYYVKFPGALGHYEQRYLYIVAPWLVAGLATGATASRLGWRRLGAALLLLAAAQSIWGVPRALALNSRNNGFTRGELEGVARWCRENLPPGSKVLVHDAGYISVATELRLVDFVGLKTPSSLEYHRVLTWPSCGSGRAEAVHRIALRHRPEYLIMLAAWDRIYRITDGLRSRGWGLQPLRPPAEIPEASTPAYRVYQLHPPSGAARAR